MMQKWNRKYRFWRIIIEKSQVQQPLRSHSSSSVQEAVGVCLRLYLNAFSSK
jgi:hypothetical protein